MSISAITVLTLIVCRVRAHIVTDDENYYTAGESQPTYHDLSGEDTLVDPSHQEYVQKAVENTVKIDRDDLTLTAGKTATFTLPTTTYHGPSFTQTSSFGHGGGVAAGGHGGGGIGGGGHGGGGGGTSFSSFGHNAGGSSFGNQNPFPATFGHGGGSTSFGGYGGGGGHGSDGGFGSLAPIIHKSVYVHVAPPEEDVPQQRVIVPRVAPRKNYQIVFIKAPTPPPPAVPVIPPFPPQSDKTLIYVLHPKAEEAPPIHIPAPPQNNPAKPEVYFIRYKTNKETIPADGGGIGGGIGGYHRRYGRDDEEIERESLESSDTTSRTSPAESEVPPDQYDEQQNDSSGESSNLFQIFTTERGLNAH